MKRFVKIIQISKGRVKIKYMLGLLCVLGLQYNPLKSFDRMFFYSKEMAGPRIMLFCCNVDEGAREIPGWGHCMCGVCMFSPYLHGFSPSVLVSLPSPKDVHIRLIGV